MTYLNLDNQIDKDISTMTNNTQSLSRPPMPPSSAGQKMETALEMEHLCSICRIVTAQQKNRLFQGYKPSKPRVTNSPKMRPPKQANQDAPVAPLPMGPLSVRITDAIAITGIGRTKLYELISQGELDIVKVGTSTLVKVASLQRLIDKGC